MTQTLNFQNKKKKQLVETAVASNNLEDQKNMIGAVPEGEDGSRGRDKEPSQRMKGEQPMCGQKTVIVKVVIDSHNDSCHLFIIYHAHVPSTILSTTLILSHLIRIITHEV